MQLSETAWIFSPIGRLKGVINVSLKGDSMEVWKTRVNNQLCLSSYVSRLHPIEWQTKNLPQFFNSSFLISQTDVLYYHTVPLKISKNKWTVVSRFFVFKSRESFKGTFITANDITKNQLLTEKGFENSYTGRKNTIHLLFTFCVTFYAFYVIHFSCLTIGCQKRNYFSI
ncbi:hypothetical protein GJ496_000743 [Pomphorhynchus laevis]|nr:hypothetical protein GJ496_000743 [Pomphorhynchus laevis]